MWINPNKFSKKTPVLELLRSPLLPKKLRYSRGNVVIYALVDPRDETIRYVGVTNDRSRRLEEHSNSQKGNRSLRDWTAELRVYGCVLEMIQLGNAGGDWEQAEINWIAWFRENGFALYNIHKGGIRHEERTPAPKKKSNPPQNKKKRPPDPEKQRERRIRKNLRKEKSSRRRKELQKYKREERVVQVTRIGRDRKFYEVLCARRRCLDPSAE